MLVRLLGLHYVIRHLLISNAVERAVIVEAEISRVNDVIRPSLLRKDVQGPQISYSEPDESLHGADLRSQRCTTDL